MNFLQPFILWGLPLVLIPVLVHLLNRMRYRTVPWATLMFLLAAMKHSTRQARIREWLILLLRTLAVLALVLAIARPLAGGWLGGALGAAPDTIILALDRSASMETQDPVTRLSKRQLALRRFSEGGQEYAGRSRFVFLDSATLKPQELAGLTALESLDAARPSDTAASIPALMDAALEYVGQNQCGRAEIWLASDQQASNWQTESKQWDQVRERYSNLKQDVRVRLLGLTQAVADNIAVAVREAVRRKTATGYELALTAELTRPATGSVTFPLTIVHEGARSQVSVTFDGQRQAVQCTLDLGSKTEAGWGWVEVPADANPGDNLAFFSYAEDLHLKSTIVAESTPARRILKLAAAPAPEALNQSAEDFSDGDNLKLTDTALLIWQAAAPSGTVANAVADFIRDGGVAIYLPAGPGEENKSRIAHWRTTDGALANSKEGKAIPLNELEILRRDVPAVDGAVLAVFDDGKPLLTRRVTGKGAEYGLATRPEAEWSNLEDGTVLVPLLQRLLVEGGRRLSMAGQGEVGTIRAERIDCLSIGEGSAQSAKPSIRAGVYRVDNRIVSVNRPALEEEPETAPGDAVMTAMGAIPARLFEDKGGAKSALQSEIWQWVLIAMLLFMTGEAILALPEPVKARTWAAPIERGEKFGEEKTAAAGTNEGSPA